MNGWGSQSGGGRTIGRVFGEGENPLSWSLPVAALRGLTVRLHLVFVVFIAVRVVQSIQTQQAGLVFQIVGLVGLLLLVLGHELAHVFAARRVGVTHDRAVLWPLGGLHHGDKPDRPGQMAIMACAGPALHLLLLVPLAGLTFWASGSWNLVFFDPFAYRGTAAVASAEGLLAWLIWSLHANNLMLLGLNLLVPMHPFDAGRVVQAAIWRMRSEPAAARGSGTLGLISAVVLAGIGLVANETVLLGIAVIGAFVSWQEISHARFLDLDSGDWIEAPDPVDTAPGEVIPDNEAVDRLLSKISAHGIESLSDEERRVLDRASAAGTDL